MSTIQTTLEEILTAIRPNSVPGVSKQDLNTFKQEVSRFMQQRFPLHHERVGEPREIGSTVKGTDIRQGFDLDLLVPFKNGYRLNPKGMKAEVLRALQQHFAGTGTTVRDQRVSVGLIRKVNGQELRIDVVPAMEKTPATYTDSAPEDKKFLTLYDREGDREWTTNIERQQRLLKDNALNYRDTVRLLKAWRHKAKHPIGSYALELLVYRAATQKDAPKSGSPQALLNHVLKSTIPFLREKGTLQDNGAGYPWTDFLKPEAKVQLAALWQKILSALESGDAPAFRGLFPV